MFFKLLVARRVCGWSAPSERWKLRRRATEELSCFLQPPGPLVQHRQVVDRQRDVGVVTAQLPLQHADRMVVQASGGGDPPALLLDGRQPRLGQAHLQAGVAEATAENGQRPAIETRRLREAAARLDDGSQRRDVGRHDRVPGPKRRLAQGDRPARVRLRLGEALARVRDAAQVVVQGRARLRVAPRQQRGCSLVERGRLRVAPLGLAQHAQVVERRRDQRLARAQPPGRRQRGAIQPVGLAQVAPGALHAGQRQPGLDGQPGEVGMAAGARQDRQRAPMAGDGRGQLIARLQHAAQLDQRVRQVGAARPLRARVAGDGAAAGAFGRGEAAGGAQDDGPLVSGDRLRESRVVAGDGCLRAPLYRRRPDVDADLPGARGDPDLGDGLRAGGAQVPAGRVSAFRSPTAGCARPVRPPSTAPRSTRWRRWPRRWGWTPSRS